MEVVVRGRRLRASGGMPTGVEAQRPGRRGPGRPRRFGRAAGRGRRVKVSLRASGKAADVECHWCRVLAKLEANTAALVESGGLQKRKFPSGRTAWVVRVETGDRGRRSRRSIYLGDESLVARTRDWLADLREPATAAAALAGVARRLEAVAAAARARAGGHCAAARRPSFR
jgi:hypothetical protein